jgi:hypothetical protein
MKLDYLSSLSFKFTFQSAIRMIRKNQMGLKETWTHQLLDYDDDINLMGDEINTIKKNTDSLTVVMVNLEADTEKNKCMLLSQCKHSGKIMI